MRLIDRTYDFGPSLPPGLTLLGAVQYILSTALDIEFDPENTDAAIRQRHLAEVAAAFDTALAHLATFSWYEREIRGAGERAYADPDPRYSEIAQIYTERIRAAGARLDAADTSVDPDTLYSAYVATEILADALRTGRSDCREYAGLDPGQIIETYGRAKAQKTYPEQAVVLTLHTRGALDPLVLAVAAAPTHTAELVRRRYYRAYVAARVEARRQAVFTVFFDTVIQSRGRTLEDGLAQLKAQPAPVQYDLVERVYDLYEMGLVAADADFGVPTKEEVDEAERFAAPPAEPRRRPPVSALPLENTVLNYRERTAYLTVGGLYFPSIMHYVLYCVSGKQYSLVADMSLLELNDAVPDPYRFLPDIAAYCFRAAYLNEFEGMGRKLLDDIAEAGAETPHAQGSLEQRVVFVFADAQAVVQRVAAYGPLPRPQALAGIVWAYNKRTAVLDKVLPLLRLGGAPLTLRQKSVVVSLSLGICLPGSIDMDDPLDKILFAATNSLVQPVLARHHSITPEKIVDYARRTHALAQPRSKLPRPVALPVEAIKHVLRIVEQLELDTARAVATALNIIAGETVAPAPEYDDNNALISMELAVAEAEAALINGFVQNIYRLANSDEIYRRIMFYAE